MESVNGRIYRDKRIQSWVCERKNLHVLSLNSKRFIKVLLTFCASTLDTFTQTERK